MTNYIQQCQGKDCATYTDGHGSPYCSDECSMSVKDGVRILVPPGIGDIYWVLVRLPALMAKYGWDRPELTVVSHPDANGGHLRGIPYLEMFDWFTIGNPQSVPNDTSLQDIWTEAYTGPGRDVIPNVQGYDYLISYNGRVNSGGFIEEGGQCNWLPSMSPAAQDRIWLHKVAYKEIYGDFAVMFWPFYGTYESHERNFTVDKIAEALTKFCDCTGLTTIFVGADWDRQYNPRVNELIKMLGYDALDFIGKTNLEQTFGLLKGAKMVLGYHAGITNMAAVFGTKTLLLWDDRWPPSTSYAVVPPNVRGTTYKALETKGLTVEVYLKEMLRLFER